MEVFQANILENPAYLILDFALGYFILLYDEFKVFPNGHVRP